MKTIDGFVIVDKTGAPFVSTFRPSREGAISAKVDPICAPQRESTLTFVKRNANIASHVIVLCLTLNPSAVRWFIIFFIVPSA